MDALELERIDAITLATHDMQRATEFYRQLGAREVQGGPGASFTTFEIGGTRLNLVLEPREISWSWWGRLVFHVADVDAAYRWMTAAGLAVEHEPTDAEWGERFFHVRDPDGHQLSIARPLARARLKRQYAAMRNSIDEASEDSFPASDPPSFTR